MDDAQKSQVVDLFHEVRAALEELGARLPHSGDGEVNVFNRAASALHSALEIPDS
jgi:hypothetical protein